MSQLEEIERILREMKRVLRKDGTIIFVTASTEATEGNWVSLSYSFPENDKQLQSGDTVKLLIQGIDVVLHDYFWTEHDYTGAAERSPVVSDGLFVRRSTPELYIKSKGSERNREARSVRHRPSRSRQPSLHD